MGKSKAAFMMEIIETEKRLWGEGNSGFTKDGAFARSNHRQRKPQTMTHMSPSRSISGSSSSEEENDRRAVTLRDLYSLRQVLSDTSNGTVFSGRRRRDGRPVAIKRIMRSRVKRWGMVRGRQVPMEVALLRRVNEKRHAGIVEVLEWFECALLPRRHGQTHPRHGPLRLRIQKKTTQRKRIKKSHASNHRKSRTLPEPFRLPP